MNLSTARNKAQRSADHRDITLYIVAECGDYDWCTEYELDTYYQGASILEVIEPHDSDTHHLHTVARPNRKVTT